MVGWAEVPCFGHGWAKKENRKENIVAYTWWLQPLSACIIQRLSLLLCSSVVDRPVSERNMHRWRKMWLTKEDVNLHCCGWSKLSRRLKDLDHISSRWEQLFWFSSCFRKLNTTLMCFAMAVNHLISGATITPKTSSSRTAHSYLHRMKIWWYRTD